VADRGRFFGQDEEGGVEGILGILLVVQDPAAHTQDHRAVPPGEGSERLLVLPAEEGIQELVVGLVTAGGGQLADVAENGVQGGVGHDNRLSNRCRPLR
jgi:hypothetical protein